MTDRQRHAETYWLGLCQLFRGHPAAVLIRRRRRTTRCSPWAAYAPWPGAVSARGAHFSCSSAPKNRACASGAAYWA